MASGGIVWTAVVAAAVVAAIEDAAAITAAQTLALAGATGYRPSQWSGSPLTSITVAGVPAASGGSSTSDINNSGTTGDSGVYTLSSTSYEQQGTSDTVYVFDGVMRVDHDREIRSTEHAAQSSANFSDHAFIEGARLSMEVEMSDCMDSYIPGSWTGAGTKSVNAYQTMEALAMSRTFVTVTTRLRTYQNMLITRINAPDSVETLHGLRARFEFKEQFVGTTTVQAVSARPQTTTATNIGQKQSVPVPAAIVNQNQVTGSSNVSGAGTYSSDSTAIGVIGS